MRLFVALDIANDIRARIQRFVEGVSGFAPDARWVRPETLHVTLKFIGEKPDDSVEPIKAALSSARSQPIEVGFRGCGFFPNPKLPRIFWVGIESGPKLASLAAAIDGTLLPLGVLKETHPFNPHITLARAGRSTRPKLRQRDDRRKELHSNGPFDHLQGKLTALPVPEFGTMTAREFFLYESKLFADGSRYFKIARFGLQ
ncbi:MAG: RNA 2',3'-cyclic phosphodiesterase [Terriglobales bacterium]